MNTETYDTSDQPLTATITTEKKMTIGDKVRFNENDWEVVTDGEKEVRYDPMFNLRHVVYHHDLKEINKQ